MLGKHLSLNHTPSPKHALNEEVGLRLVLNLKQRAVLNRGDYILWRFGILKKIYMYAYVCTQSRWMSSFVLQFPVAGVRGGCKSMGAFLRKSSK